MTYFYFYSQHKMAFATHFTSNMCDIQHLSIPVKGKKIGNDLIYSLGTCWISKMWPILMDDCKQVFFLLLNHEEAQMCIKKVNRVNFDVMLTSKVKHDQ